jgi:hypothetical protein
MYFGLLGFGLIAGLFGIIIGLVIQVLFLLNLMQLIEAVHPTNRAMSPGLVWLNLIPIFGLGWMIYTVIKIKDSLDRENRSRGATPVDDRNSYTVGLVYSILAVAAFVVGYGGYVSRGASAFGGVISLAVLITWIIYWVRTHRVKNDLQATAGRYGGGQYGPGAPYPPSGPGYGQSGQGYGPGYGSGPAPQGPPPGWQPQGAPPSSSEPPAPTPPSGGDPGAPASGAAPNNACIQCGKEFGPDDQFCSACGMPAPRK